MPFKSEKVMGCHEIYYSGGGGNSDSDAVQSQKEKDTDHKKHEVSFAMPKIGQTIHCQCKICQAPVTVLVQREITLAEISEISKDSYCNHCLYSIVHEKEVAVIYENVRANSLNPAGTALRVGGIEIQSPGSMEIAKRN